MSILGAIKEVFKRWNSWEDDKEGRLRREIETLEGKVKLLQEKPATKGRVNKIIKLKKKIEQKKDYLIQGAK